MVNSCVFRASGAAARLDSRKSRAQGSPGAARRPVSSRLSWGCMGNLYVLVPCRGWSLTPRLVLLAYLPKGQAHRRHGPVCPAGLAPHLLGEAHVALQVDQPLVHFVHALVHPAL